MDENCRNKIISEDYADFIVEYSYGIEDVLREYESECINIVDRKNGVVYSPLSIIEEKTSQELGYSTFPKCYGLDDLSSLSASGLTTLREIPDFDLRGTNVLVCIIDTGIDYRNNAFKNQDGTSRIYSIWDQTIQSDNFPPNTNYGTEYTKEQINQALTNADPLSIVPSMDTVGHGTFLAGIAAGSPDFPNDFSGIATEAELIVVKIKEAKKYLRDYYVIPDSAVCYQENDLMFGVKYAAEKAQSLGRPCVICIALGSSQGGHEGRGPLSDQLSYVGDFPNTAIVLSAGNEGNSGHHFHGTIAQSNGYSTMELNVAENEPGFSMEIWGTAPNTYSIDLLSPTGEYISRIPARINESRRIQFTLEQTIVQVDYIIIERVSGDQVIIVRFRNPTAGVWRIRVYGAGDINLEFHCWLPMNRFVTNGTRFLNPDPYITLTAPAASPLAITVTAYNHKLGNIYQDASRGYTRYGSIKPELAAPGVDLNGPTINNEYVVRSGTSIAAAYTSGIVALLMQWAIADENYNGMSSQELKKLLIRGAERSPNETYPNPIWGYGTLNIYNTFNSFREPPE